MLKFKKTKIVKVEDADKTQENQPEKDVLRDYKDVINGELSYEEYLAQLREGFLGV